MYKGNPIAEAQVTFYPQGQGNPGTGRTEDNGRFVLTTTFGSWLDDLLLLAPIR